MKLTLKEQQQSIALNILETLDIFKPYINAFKDKGTVTVFEQYCGYYIEEDSKLYKDIKQFEEQHGCLVYAVTHEYTSFGECYDYLIIPKEKSDWKDLIFYSNGNKHVIFAYVENKDAPWCGEYGDITIKSFGGGLYRIV